MLAKYSFYFLFFIFSNSISAEENQTHTIIETNTIEYFATESVYLDFINKCLADGNDNNYCDVEYKLYINHFFRTL